MDDKLVSLCGEVKKIVFQNPENGYTVCILEDENGEEHTLNGVLPALSAGEYLSARAKISEHPVYGRQWRVQEFEKTLPRDEGAVLRYLSGHALKGVGKKRAEKIVSRFGADTLSVLEHSPEMLTAIPGISKRLAREIGEQFRAQFGLRQVLLFFGGTFGPKTSLAIHRALGSSAVDLVRKNPYLLCERVRGIGFSRADELAKSIGYKQDSPARKEAGLEYTLRRAWERDGQVYLPKHQLFACAGELLGVGEAELEEALVSLCARSRAVREEDRVYTPMAYAYECEAANRLVNLARVRLFARIDGVQEALARAEAAEGITYSESQRRAIITAANEPFSIVTGGPGTGKTTITRALARLFLEFGMKVCLAAPTGRAAKRLSEKSGLPARTLHRVLEMAYGIEDGHSAFGRNAENPLEESVFLIDEVSMVDLELFVHFLRAVKPGSRVIFIGDADQLPSVGAGNVLSDLISSGALAVTRLDVIYRQGETSGILRYAHEVRVGAVHRLRENEGDLFYLARPSADQTAETVTSLLSTRLPKSYGRESLASTQVLCPARRGAAGTLRLNVLLQAALNPPQTGRRETVSGGLVFREGDRVMQIRNDYDLQVRGRDENGVERLTQGVFNGDIGEIVSVDLAREEVCVRFEEGEATYPFFLLDELEHAWAITVHKSQGSEYDTVVLALSGTPPQLRRRALLYTAVTRAKKRLILVGSARLAEEMALSASPEERRSWLNERIASAF